MAKLHDQWEVLPHEPLHKVAPGVLTVVGQIPMPLGNFPRRMTAVALGRRRCAIYSPIALPDREMARIEALGVPAFLIVPSGAHRLDLRPFHARYPRAKVVTARGAIAKVREGVSTVETSASLGAKARLMLLAGTGEAELAMLVRHDGGASLILNDLIGHVAHPRGIGAAIMSRLMGFGPKPRITRAAMRFLIKDKVALAKQLREWAGIKDLQRIIPSHGEIIDRPAALLRRLADDLA